MPKPSLYQLTIRTPGPILRTVFGTWNLDFLPVGHNSNVRTTETTSLTVTTEHRDAPHKLQTRFCLKILYEPWLSTDPRKGEHIQRFFHDALYVEDCGWGDCLDELKHLRVYGSEDSDIITALYETLYSRWQSKDESHQIWCRRETRDRFEKYDLVYVASSEGSAWHKPSECVWSTAARLRGKVSLNNEYEGLRGLFVDVLDVKQVTLSMAIDELKEAGGRQSVSVEEVKVSILTVNSLLCSESEPQHPELLENGKIFPVIFPGEGVRCVSAQTQFFIVDRESLRSLFEEHVKLFDFNLEEVVQLHPFLNWIRLGDRYISRCVREFTSVQDPGTCPISKYGHEFRHRAHALLRFVRHFRKDMEQTH